jgi:hypothetical protein
MTKGRDAPTAKRGATDLKQQNAVSERRFILGVYIAYLTWNKVLVHVEFTYKNKIIYVGVILIILWNPYEWKYLRFPPKVL